MLLLLLLLTTITTIFCCYYFYHNSYYYYNFYYCNIHSYYYYYYQFVASLYSQNCQASHGAEAVGRYDPNLVTGQGHFLQRGGSLQGFTRHVTKLIVIQT